MIKQLIKLVRIKQWYKNLIIFIALIFSRSFLDINLLILAIAGFLVFCLISSSNYILNDLIDKKKDRLNPEKRTRPLASGKITTPIALLIFISLFSIGIYGSYLLSYNFMLITLIFFINSTIYTFLIKNIMIADIISIAINFLLRALAGAILIEVAISPWLVMGVFFFAMFLVLGKRFGEIKYLNDYADKHRPVLSHYKKSFVFSLLNSIMTILILIFALYSFSSLNPELIWTLPLFIYLVFRYYYFIVGNNKYIRDPINIMQDKPFLIVGLIFFILTLAFIIW